MAKRAFTFLGVFGLLLVLAGCGSSDSVKEEKTAFGSQAGPAGSASPAGGAPAPAGAGESKTSADAP